ncbi:MAG: hypothetical protein M3Q72_02815 [Actinomycetota bacterium]|nr:hypothetical protein [Actinomycetota bacterium]
MTASGDPVVTAKAFVGAVAWGEHTTVWDLLAPDARIAVLDLATRRGMDPLLAARLREGTAGDDERDGFLADLLHGLQAELVGVEVDELRYLSGDGGTTVEDSVLVHLVADVPAELGAAVPVGRIELVITGGRWSVVRLDGAS